MAESKQATKPTELGKTVVKLNTSLCEAGERGINARPGDFVRMTKEEAENFERGGLGLIVTQKDVPENTMIHQMGEQAMLQRQAEAESKRKAAAAEKAKREAAAEE